MSEFLIALKSLLFHRRVNLAIALGVAAATAVLTGALIVGDSMRGSLRDLTLDRLGKTDVLVISEGFFREDLADEIAASEESGPLTGTVTPIIYFPNGTTELANQDSSKTLGQINLLGIHPEFWQLGDDSVNQLPELGDDEVIINSVVAEDLGLSETDLQNQSIQITVGVPKQSLLPSDSSLGNKNDLVERIVDLKVVAIAPATSLGRFGLHPTQIPPRNVYLSIGAMQDALNDGILKYKESREQANVILISSKVSDQVLTPAEAETIRNNLRPQPGDVGLRLKRVTRTFGDETIFDYVSLSSDRLVLPTETARLAREAFPDSVDVITYLANDIAPVGAASDSGIPFSMVCGLDAGQVTLQSTSGETVKPLAENEIALTRWAAEDQQLNVGDSVRIAYFEPETTHGEETEQTHDFVVADIVELIEPSEPPRFRRRQEIPAVFDQRPTRANDPDFTPTVPGLTDADSIDRWDLPFDTADRIRPQDDDYWTDYRTTPKAYVAPSTAMRLWGSRFGVVTSIQIAPGSRDLQQITDQLMEHFRDTQHLPGLQVVPIKANGLKASAGSTPFDALFLSLSMFVIAAALALVSLLFRLALQKRSGEMGILLATGFREKQVGRIWLMEMAGVCVVGAAVGMLLGVGYASIMLYGLKTWWIGAISTPFLNMHIQPWTLPLGLLLGVLICVVTIFLSVRSARRKPVRTLLSGQMDSGMPDKGSWIGRFHRVIVLGCGLAAVVLTVLAATTLAGESQAGAFMTSGFLILVAALAWTYQRLQQAGLMPGSVDSLRRLSLTNAGRNPLRSTLTIGLVAIASFLILAISAFRLAPTEQGTAGFNFLATTSQPVFANLNTKSGQQEVFLNGDELLSAQSRVLSFRYKSGQDASCNNPYQSSQPQVLGVTDQTMHYFDDKDNASFTFSMTPGDNPWRLLNGRDTNGAIPVIIDKNTAWYSLKVYTPGTEFTVDYDSGESVRFKLVGLLSNSVLQGMLLISEENFTSTFPELSGYRTFLMKLADESELNRLSESLAERGFDARSTTRLLEGYLAVQNTYLSTFQSLGLLGLLLGTFGLAAVQLRSILERKGELGVMRAIGFTKQQLATMILTENAWLLLGGMSIGIFAALVTTLPHYFFGDASVPWVALVLMFGFIALTGLVTSWLASRSVFNAPLIESLRSS